MVIDFHQLSCQRRKGIRSIPLPRRVNTAVSHATGLRRPSLTALVLSVPGCLGAISFAG
jgi:hypothetical protein